MATQELPRESERGRRARERYEARRREVIQIATSVIAERGYHATTIDDLVEATGLQRGGLYHYIGGKKELLLEIHVGFIEPLVAETESIVSAGEAPDITLRDLVRSLLMHIQENPNAVSALFQEWRTILREPEWTPIRERTAEYEKLVVGTLERGHREGFFVISDMELVWQGLMGLISFSHTWFDPQRHDAETVADGLFQIFVRGIKGAKTSPDLRLASSSTPRRRPSDRSRAARSQAAAKRRAK